MMQNMGGTANTTRMDCDLGLEYKYSSLSWQTHIVHEASGYSRDYNRKETPLDGKQQNVASLPKPDMPCIQDEPQNNETNLSQSTIWMQNQPSLISKSDNTSNVATC